MTPTLMKTITRLFYDLSVYRDIVTQSLWHSLGRFSLAYILIALIYALHFSFTQLPQLLDQISTSVSTIANSIPQNAEIKLENANLSTNNIEIPLTIKVNDPNLPNPLLYIDPRASASDLSTSSAAIAFGKTHAKIITETGASTLLNYQQEGFPDFTLTGSMIKTTATSQNEFANKLRPLIPLLITIPIWIFFQILRLFHTLFYAAILKLVSFIGPSRPPLATFFKITLSTVIVADAITALVLILYQTTYPVIFSTAFVGVTLLVLLKTPAPGKIR